MGNALATLVSCCGEGGQVAGVFAANFFWPRCRRKWRVSSCSATELAFRVAYNFGGWAIVLITNHYWLLP
ncbi:MAG: hypothetical protein ABI178_14870 [Rhodanobacter sp.]